MAGQQPFYTVSSYTGNLREGQHIEVRRQLLYQGENADFKPFAQLPVKELEKRLKESVKAEKKVFDEMQTAVKAWDRHGAETLLLQNAIAYVRTPAVKHTGNEWKKRKDGVWEISNLVYHMMFEIQGQGEEWRLTWGLQYTAPALPKDHTHNPYDGWPKRRLEYENNKKYRTLEGAQKYIQAKFDQYAAFFSELSPPVPEAVKRLFCVSGQLLPGYTLAEPERTGPDRKLVDELLNYLGEGDLDKASPAQEERAPPVPEERATPSPKPAHRTAKPQNRKKAKTNPVR